MTLYEMTENALTLYGLLGAEEIDEQTVEDTLAAMGVGEKLEDYCKVIRQFEADTGALKNEIDRLSEKKKKAENAILRLKKAIQNYMTATGKDKVQCGVFDIKVSKSKAAIITNEDVIPAIYRVAQPDKIDKSEIRKALLAGEVIEGAELTINQNVSIK